MTHCVQSNRTPSRPFRKKVTTQRRGSASWRGKPTRANVRGRSLPRLRRPSAHAAGSEDACTKVFDARRIGRARNSRNQGRRRDEDEGQRLDFQAALSRQTNRRTARIGDVVDRFLLARRRRQQRSRGKSVATKHGACSTTTTSRTPTTCEPECGFKMPTSPSRRCPHLITQRGSCRRLKTSYEHGIGPNEQIRDSEKVLSMRDITLSGG